MHHEHRPQPPSTSAPVRCATTPQGGTPDPGTQPADRHQGGSTATEDPRSRARQVCALLAERLRQQGRPGDAEALSAACESLTDPRTSNWTRNNDGRWTTNAKTPTEHGRLEVAATPADARQAANAMPMPNGNPPIVLVDGADPPWLLGEIFARTNGTQITHASCIILAAQDWGGIVRAAAYEPSGPWLTDPRVHVFAGDHAGEAFARWLDARSAYLTSGVTIGTASALSPVAENLLTRLSDELRRKAEEDTQLREKIAARDRSRDKAHWAQRYRDALHTGKGLRVLVITTRYSTYMNHAARGLAETLTKKGHNASLLIEPDGHTKMSSVTYLRAIDQVDPDLIVTINYQRKRIGDFIPRGIPYVTWTQDAMPHLFHHATPAADTDRDFVIGHLERSMFRSTEEAATRAACMPVLASETDFHRGPLDPDRSAQLACDVAWISNHGETPGMLTDRVLSGAGLTPESRALLESLGADVQAFITRPGLPDKSELLEQSRARLTRAGFNPSDTEQLILGFVMPLAERTLRHQTARWARDICERRGWRMRVFGIGWERTTEFAHLAGGSIAHGEDLRTAYASAAATPHVNLGSTLHQRIFECALSGGLPLCRRTEADARFEWKSALRSVIHRTNTQIHGEDEAELHIADHPELMRTAAQQHRIGRTVETRSLTLKAPEADLLRNDVILKSLPSLSTVLGDLEQTTFSNPDELEALLDQAIHRPAWREQLSSGIAGRVRNGFTLNAMAERMISLVGRELGVEP